MTVWIWKLIVASIWIAGAGYSSLGISTSTSCVGLLPISSPTEVTGTKWGFADCTGSIVIEPVHDQTFYSDNVGVILDGRTSTLVDSGGKLLLSLPDLEVLSAFSDGLSIARKGAEFLIIDTRGDVSGKLPKEFELGDPSQFSFGQFSDGLLPVQLGTQVVFINRFGKIVIQNEIEATNGFCNGLARVVLSDGRIGIINQSGTMLYGPSSRPVSDPSDKSIVVRLSKRNWIVLNEKGIAVLNLRFDYVGSFHEGLAQVNNGDRWGFINKSGEIVVPLSFEDATDYSEGLAGVMIGKRWGFISKTGKIEIPAQFDLIERPFRNSRAYVSTVENEGYINRKGRFVWRRPRIDTVPTHKLRYSNN